MQILNISIHPLCPPVSNEMSGFKEIGFNWPTEYWTISSWPWLCLPVVLRFIMKCRMQPYFPNLVGHFQRWIRCTVQRFLNKTQNMQKTSLLTFIFRIRFLFLWITADHISVWSHWPLCSLHSFSWSLI